MTEEPDRRFKTVMARHHYTKESLIEILHSAQQIYGYLSVPLLKEIARRLRLPPSRVLGVATFYRLFRLAPPARRTAGVCTGTACYIEGSTELAKIVNKSEWKLEEVRCVGSCGLAPIVVCGGVALPRATPAQLKALLVEG
ncbi:MAG: NAD(P)H-dependent oxidoreductase subunit E [Bryobacteraceae bacterium]